MGKEFTGSWVVFVLLILCFWPGAIIYFFMKYKKVQESQQQQQQQQVVINVPGSGTAPSAPEGHKKTCLSCGQQVDIRYTICPYCNQPTSRQPPNQSF